MTRTADIPSRGSVFHLRRTVARTGLELRPPAPPGVEFPFEAVDDGLGAQQRTVSSRCGRPTGRRRPDRGRDQAPRPRRVVTDRFHARLAHTREAVCGSVRIPLQQVATQASQPSQNPSPATPSHRPMPGRFRTRLSRTRDAVCGFARIPLQPPTTRASQPFRNPSPAAPSPRPMPERFRIPLSRTRDAVCGSVRIQDGPHPSRKDTRP